MFNIMAHVGIADDRSCHTLMEERSVEKQKMILFLSLHLSAVYVDNVGDELKGVEGNSDGKSY
jgi:hypothetical protein